MHSPSLYSFEIVTPRRLHLPRLSNAQTVKMPFPRTSGIDFDTFYNIIDGRNRGGEEVQQGIDPSTGKLSWPVPVANELDLNDAVEAGQRAFPAWRDTPMQKRRETLLRFCDYLGHFTDDLVALLCKETGKPVCSAHGHSRLVSN